MLFPKCVSKNKILPCKSDISLNNVLISFWINTQKIKLPI